MIERKTKALKKNKLLKGQIISEQYISTLDNEIKFHVSNFCIICNTIKYYVSLFRKPTEGTEESQAQQPAEDSHNVAVYIKKARGGHTLYGPKKSEENFVEFLAILKKL